MDQRLKMQKTQIDAIHLPPPILGPRPMTIGGSSIFRDPNYDHDCNPIAVRNAVLEEIRLLKPPRGLKRNVAEMCYDEEKKEKKNPCRCILM